MKNKPVSLVLFASMIIFFHCGSETDQSAGKSGKAHMIQSVLWQQNAAEFKALTYQSYLLARRQLDDVLSDKNQRKSKLAVVTDIDETVLDNSAFDAKLIALDLPFSQDLWLAWGELCLADTIPGSLAFFNEVAKKGVEIFYISNRSVEQLQATIENLNKFGFPYADEAHVLLQDKTSDKEPRRRDVSKTHKIVLMLGDNLSDFSSLFYKVRSDRRDALVDSMKSSFGRRFIVFPNPMYGDWETQGIYEGKYDWTKGQMDSIRHSKLRAY